MPDVRAKYMVPATKRTQVLKRVCPKLSAADVINVSFFKPNKMLAEGILAEPAIAFVNLTAYGSPNVAWWSVSRHQKLF